MIKFSMSLILFISTFCFASQEGVLLIDDFKIESKGIGTSGPILVIGNVKDKKYELIVNAFSKKIIVPDTIISKLQLSKFNGIRISYEHGYEDLGGRTLYLILEYGFVSGLRQSLLEAVSKPIHNI